ncbi:MAG TPA: hypothetical protein VFV71_00240 [Burkholderiales bacterium]|nr:hypothetical protein [Burkholderiales bacterium]
MNPDPGQKRAQPESVHCYCTLFDKNYLTRGLALHASLQRHRPGSMLVVLCLDEATRDMLARMSLDAARLVSLDELEGYDPSLKAVRGARLPAEYYFTCKPVLMRYMLDTHAHLGRVTYLDSDLYLFSDPATLFDRYADASVLLTPHRFPESVADRIQYGLFNAGWVSAASGGEGRRFVEWWRERCLEWCVLNVEGDRFADQKYLDRVPDMFRGSVALPDKGVNLGPWSLESMDVAREGDAVSVTGEKLVFFHFHGLRRIAGHVYDSGLHEYRVRLTPEIRNFIYAPYLAALEAAGRRVEGLDPSLWRSLSGFRMPKKPIDRLRYLKKIFQVVAGGTAMVGPSGMRRAG